MQCCRVGKDPRFEALSGAYNAERFRKQYSFVFDEQLPAEKSSLRAAMKVRRPLGQHLQIVELWCKLSRQLARELTSSL
jgi:rRNA biogenesis protein RRP36